MYKFVVCDKEKHACNELEQMLLYWQCFLS